MTADIQYKIKKETRLRAGHHFVYALLRALSVVVLITIAVFFLMRLVPGDPAVMVLGEHADGAEIQKLREQLMLNEPLSKQFAAFLGNIFLHFDTGDSIKYGVSSRDLVLQYAPVTLALVAYASVITVISAVILAFLAATHKDSLIDHAIRVIPAFTQGMPVFWIGLILISVFAVNLGWFPVGGVGSGMGGFWHSLTLPAVTIALGQIPSLVRSLREQLLEIMDADFVLTLRAAKIPKSVIFRKHIFKNAFVPTLMLFSVNLSYMIGGTLIIERVFAVRGMGKLLFDAISNRDFPLVQAVTLYCAVFVVLISLITELIAAKADPRMRQKEKSFGNNAG